MQTFVPDSSGYAASLRVLDNSRLGKMRVEGFQILLALMRVDKHGVPREPRGWKTHVATEMWRGHEVALLEYVVTACIVWRQRGLERRGVEYKDTVAQKAIHAWGSSVIHYGPWGNEWRYMEVAGVTRQLSRIYDARAASLVPAVAPPPPWWGDERVHRSHQRALYCKDPVWYSRARREASWDPDVFAVPVSDGYRYFWPSPSPGKWGELRV